MNQIEWCQVRLDITQEIQVTWRSKLPGDPSYPEIRRWEIYPEIRRWEIYSEIQCWEIYPEIQDIIYQS